MIIQIAIRALKKLLTVLGSPALESLPGAPDLFRVYRKLLNDPRLERLPGGWIYEGKFYPDYLTVGGASHAIFREALKFCHGRGVDLGAGFWPLPGAVPVDLERGPGLGMAITDFAENSLDFIFSSHCLEHIENWKETLSEWIARLNEGGLVFLYLPPPSCGIWHPGSPMVGDGHKWIPTPEHVKVALTACSCEIIAFDDGPDAMSSFFVCAKRLTRCSE
jgi:hypothetical protein